VDHKLYAFWEYDHFPYVLGGEVTKMDDRGRVETVEYGPGFRFTPFKILPLDAGRNLMAQIKHIAAQYETSARKLRERKLKEVTNLLPELKRVK
jgi:hypothetical protein